MSAVAGGVDAVLFDLDGTVVDSLPALRSAYDKFLASHNITGSDEDFRHWNGPPLVEIVEGLAAKYQLAGEPRILLEEYERAIESAYVEGASLAPGASGLFEWLQTEGVRVAIVTSAPRRLVFPLVEARGLRTYAGVVIAGDDISHGKPAPDCYRLALERLGVAAEDAIAVEDSPAGVQAACAAGVRCVGIGARREALLQAGAIAAVEGLEQVKHIVDGLRRGAGRVIVARQFEVRVLEHPPPVGDALELRVQESWKSAVAERSSLTDGEIVAVDKWRAVDQTLHVDVVLTRYRYVLAQRRGIPLGVVPLGVSGVTRLVTGEFIIGRRSPSVTEYSGYWELIPSGGVSRRRVAADGSVDIAGQLLEELEEELGTTSDRVRQLVPLGLVEDLADSVIDLAFLIQIDAAPSEMSAGILRNQEYDAVNTMSLEDIESFCREADQLLVPTVLPLLELLQERTRGAP